MPVVGESNKSFFYKLERPIKPSKFQGYQGVHLAISEDHVWVVFGPEEQRETIQVTWHGKVFEDKRGESVEGADSKSWLYLAGCPVVCDRFMEISALVLAINPSLNLTCACLEVTELQKSLLWLLYDHGHLERYPMGLGNLGELEEFVTSSSADKRPTSEELYRQSVRSSRKWYHNYHVYPYTYQGNYYYRKLRYREAFAAWASAGDVIRRYVYSSKDDEEIYKELLDIANEQIPSIMKTESSGHSARSILRDSRCFANLLRWVEGFELIINLLMICKFFRFYDGICKWEEGSLTPILHIGWAKPITSTIGKYDYDIRSQVIIHAADDDEEIPEVAAEEVDRENNGVGAAGEANNNSLKTANNNSTGGGVGGSSLAKVELPPRLAALTAACGEKLLNPNFLTGGEEQPFTTTDGDNASDNVQKGGDSSEDKKEVISMKQEVLASPAALVVDHDDEPRRPVIKLFSQKMKGLRNLLLGEKLNTQAILLQMTAQSQVGAGKKANRGSTNDTSAKGDDVSAGGGVGGGSSSVGNNTTSALNDGEVTSSGRPKRSRREWI